MLSDYRHVLSGHQWLVKNLCLVLLPLGIGIHFTVRPAYFFSIVPAYYSKHAFRHAEICKERLHYI